MKFLIKYINLDNQININKLTYLNKKEYNTYLTSYLIVKLM